MPTRPHLAAPLAALATTALLAGCTSADGGAAPEPEASAEPASVAPTASPSATSRPDVREDAPPAATDPWSDPDATTGPECLVGTWQFDLGTYLAAELTTDPSKLRTTKKSAGASTWTFGADGTLTTSIEGFSIAFTDDVVQMTIRGKGARVGTWRLVDGRLSTTTDTAATTLEVVATAEAGGQKVDTSEDVQAVVERLSLTGSPVACLDDVLHVRTVDGQHRVLTQP